MQTVQSVEKNQSLQHNNGAEKQRKHRTPTLTQSTSNKFEINWTKNKEDSAKNSVTKL